MNNIDKLSGFMQMLCSALRENFVQISNQEYECRETGFDIRIENKIFPVSATEDNGVACNISLFDFKIWDIVPEEWKSSVFLERVSFGHYGASPHFWLSVLANENETYFVLHLRTKRISDIRGDYIEKQVEISRDDAALIINNYE